MKIFQDYYNNEVKLSFEDHPFEQYPKHVWVICRYNTMWLLTKHSDRGLEFPGGKVEKGETAEEAAIREVREETGGVISQITYVGQYFVAGKASSVTKNVYFATIKELKEQETYYETEGPVLLKELPSNMVTNPSYSFMMKDQVLPYSLEQINHLVDY